MPRAVFFDMDDTLLDTSGGIGAAWEIACQDAAPELGCDWQRLRDAIRREGVAFWRDEAKVGSYWRPRLEESRLHVVKLALTAEGLDVARAEALAARYNVEAVSRIQLFEDALETLTVLRAQGYRLALITNGPAVMQHRKVERFGLAAHFDALVVEGAFGAGKPDRRVFEHALEATGVAAAEAWHVGDNLYADVGGAQNAGLHAVWIHRGRLEPRQDVAVTPDRVIEHLGELRWALEAEQPVS